MEKEDIEEIEKKHHHHHHDTHCKCCHDEDEHEHHHNTHCSCHDDDDECEHEDEKKERIILICRMIISVILLVISFFTGEIASIILLSVSYLVIGYDVIYKAIINVFHGEPFDECFLMTIASLTALLVSFINKDSGIDGFDGVLVMILYQLGEFLQDLAVDKSKDSIQDMLSLDVKYATLLVDNEEKEIPIEEIKVDDILLIKPGKTIPVDGIIIEGSTSIDTKKITGESKPIDAYVGDKVISSSINNDGLIKIKALSTIENSTAANIQKVVKEATKNKTKSETFIRKFAKIYTPIVILISLLVMFVVPLFLGFGDNITKWVYKGLSIMIISCPCALVISVPLASFVGIGKMASNAILLKGASHIETLSKVDAIALDKTGTITKGDFEVTSHEFSDKKLAIDLLYSIEKSMSHPLSKSIVNYFDKEANILDIDNITNLPGYGCSAIYNGKQVLVGNERLLSNNNIVFEPINSVGTVIYVCFDGNYLGFVTIEDKLKDEASDEMAKLKDKYLLYLLTGDNEKTAKDIADKLSVDIEVHSKLLPEDKYEHIKRIKENNVVCYVGDGINDATCLIEADVGIAMKTLDSDVAISASDVVIMDGNIKNVRKAILISKKTSRIIKENIIGSILIKMIIMILAICIEHLPIWLSITADVGVCLLAIFNSLRIWLGKYN